MVKFIATWTSVILAFLAAGLWWWSTKVEVDHNAQEVDESGMHPFAIINVDSSTGKKIDILATAERQVVWNRWAAMAAGGSALFQGIASALP